MVNLKYPKNLNKNIATYKIYVFIYYSISVEEADLAYKCMNRSRIDGLNKSYNKISKLKAN